jgi:hypothetical protein
MLSICGEWRISSARRVAQGVHGVAVCRKPGLGGFGGGSGGASAGKIRPLGCGEGFVDAAVHLGQLAGAEFHAGDGKAGVVAGHDGHRFNGVRQDLGCGQTFCRGAFAVGGDLVEDRRLVGLIEFAVLRQALGEVVHRRGIGRQGGRQVQGHGGISVLDKRHTPYSPSRSPPNPAESAAGAPG